MYQVFISEQADTDLENIAEYIAQDNPYRAISFTQQMLDSITSQLSSFPDLGIGYFDSAYIPYKNYLVFCDINRGSQMIWVTHIINSAQYTAYKDLITK